VWGSPRLGLVRVGDRAKSSTSTRSRGAPEELRAKLLETRAKLLDSGVDPDLLGPPAVQENS
jgi:hypothetical protein